MAIHSITHSFNHSALAQTTRKAFINGKIYTVNEQQPYAEMVMTEGNKITYVGKTKDMNFWPKEEVEKYGYQIIAFK